MGLGKVVAFGLLAVAASGCMDAGTALSYARDKRIEATQIVQQDNDGKGELVRDLSCAPSVGAVWRTYSPAEELAAKCLCMGAESHACQQVGSGQVYIPISAPVVIEAIRSMQK